MPLQSKFATKCKLCSSTISQSYKHTQSKTGIKTRLVLSFLQNRNKVSSGIKKTVTLAFLLKIKEKIRLTCVGRRRSLFCPHLLLLRVERL